MAPSLTACRLGASVASRALRSKLAARGLSSSAQQWAAQNFVMPAMSPTMTEGNITKWNFKEGDSFSAGDVLLDIETDKAQMDVEAQEDGLLAKIIQPDSTKSIKVGTRIAVLAEPGDDLQSLEMPPDESPKQAAPQEAASQPQPKETSSAPAQGGQSQLENASEPPSNTVRSSQKYPLYPSVQALFGENGLRVQDAEKMPASGPNGRLLKGDVLAYLGKIGRSYSAEQSSRISGLGHLNLSNILKAEPKPKPKPAAPPKEELVPEPELETQVAVPISLSAVLATQKRVKDTLGFTLPLSTFVARASEMANEDLPRSKSTVPSMDELYDAVLGLEKVSKTSRGSYVPQVTALASEPSATTPRTTSARQRQTDIIDILTGTSPLKSEDTPQVPSATGLASPNSTNVFSVTATKGDEKRVRTYLERVKTVLEAEPGRCVL